MKERGLGPNLNGLAEFWANAEKNSDRDKIFADTIEFGPRKSEKLEPMPSGKQFSPPPSQPENIILLESKRMI